MENNLEKLQYKFAKSRMKEIKAFYIMLTGCILLSPYLIFINLKVNPEFNWFWFPLLGFGISILGYAFYLFTGKNWEKKKIKQLMEKESRNSKLL
ncbi:2TM domain-containing protein [Chryseobacterium sp. 2TAF14]|uniref:2TM domain-containing protein n=1 Tax=Chryseobacterium sp. 2TAF14 TaxID=3233007 RepID=UPI003F9359E0